MKSNGKILVGLAIFALFAVASTGCDKGMKVEYVEGTIFYNGEPVPEADVFFSPAPGSATAKSAFGKTDAQGVYKLTAQANVAKGRLKGVPEGEYVVTASKETGGYDENLVGKTPEEISQCDRLRNEGKYTPKIVPYENKLPEKYKDPATSGFTASVKKGKNLGVDFKLVD